MYRLTPKPMDKVEVMALSAVETALATRADVIIVFANNNELLRWVVKYKPVQPILFIS